ncbi:hypothetical protein [Sphingomonas sp.]|uniref:hypothetical protein n=1 Tax=Sphingomonas sp. TaxID=28214 RepID=UPI0025E2E1FB|nr:hypothetical protein [Sphingomonas sp.]
MKRYTAELLSEATGLSLVGASLQVLVTGTNQPVTLYASNDVNGAKVGQPVSNGMAFYVPDGRYDLLARNGSKSTLVPEVDFFDLSEQNRRLEAVENGEPGAPGSLRSDLVAAGGAARVGYKRTSAAILRTLDDWLKDGGLSVKDFGAKGIGTDDTVALKKTAAEAAGLEANGLKVPVLLPHGRFGTHDTIQIKSGLIGLSMQSSHVVSLSSGDFALDQPIVRLGWLEGDRPEQCTVPFRDFRVIGSGVRAALRSADPTTMGFAGIGILYDEQAYGIHAYNVQVSLCRKGISHKNRFGHLGGTNIIVDNCWFNMWWEYATGDFRYYDCIFTGAQFATYGCHGSNRVPVISPGGINGLLLSGCHGGFAPHLFYQEDGDGGQGLSGITLINSSAEQIGNRLVRLGNRTAGQRRVSSGWDIAKLAHTWTDPGKDIDSYNSYTIQGNADFPIHDYAITGLDLVQGFPLDFRGDCLTAGTSGYAAQVTDALAFIKDETGMDKWLIAGQGADRLIYTGKPSHQETKPATNLPLSGELSPGTTEVTFFDVPKAIDGTTSGSIEFASVDFNNTTGAAQSLQLRAAVNNGAEQVLAKLYVPVGRSKQPVKVGVNLGRRDRVADLHRVSVRLYHGSNAAVAITLNDDNVPGLVMFTAAQNKGIVA